MANHVVNDRGETVIATGAPGSQAYVTVKYPQLLSDMKEKMTDLIYEGLNKNEVEFSLKHYAMQNGLDNMDAESITQICINSY